MNKSTDHSRHVQSGVATSVPAAITPAVAATLLEYAPVGLAIIDGRDHTILYGNAQLSRILQEPHMARERLHLADLFRSDVAMEIEMLVAEVVSRNQVITRKALPSDNGAGGRRAWDVTVAPLQPDDAQGSRVMLHVVDVMEAVYGRTDARQVEEFERIKEDFLAVTAHELRTPVTALLGYTNLMLSRAERADWTDRDLHALRMIQVQARRLTQLINGLVDVARIQTGEVELRLEQVDLVELVRRVTKELRPSIGDYTIGVAVPAKPIMIWGDTHRIEQVLTQLLDNAVKFSPWGGTIQVRVSADDQAHLAVVDHGIGIPVDEQPRLFGRFYRASNVDTDRISGLGIGLYLAREFVAAHHGRIDVRSVPDQETVFEVTLPLYAD
ncbi:MAG TPA: ATP-binding protein [Herpetosiphonaceae bacterium]|nr:ATP-binding protein [Herpetosiphonaceae bacterium]